MIHGEQSPLAGKTVVLKDDVQDLAGAEYRVEDWWDRVGGGSWMTAVGNPAALNYAMRAGIAGLPLDNRVLYGKVGSFGHLVHESEIESK